MSKTIHIDELESKIKELLNIQETLNSSLMGDSNTKGKIEAFKEVLDLIRPKRYYSPERYFDGMVEVGTEYVKVDNKPYYKPVGSYGGYCFLPQEIVETWSTENKFQNLDIEKFERSLSLMHDNRLNNSLGIREQGLLYDTYIGGDYPLSYNDLRDGSCYITKDMDGNGYYFEKGTNVWRSVGSDKLGSGKIFNDLNEIFTPENGYTKFRLVPKEYLYGNSQNSFGSMVNDLLGKQNRSDEESRLTIEGLERGSYYTTKCDDPEDPNMYLFREGFDQWINLNDQHKTLHRSNGKFRPSDGFTKFIKAKPCQIEFFNKVLDRTESI